MSEERSPAPGPVVATVMFVDIVGSTARAAAVGDLAWRELLERFRKVVRESLGHFGGREVDTAGDGLLASFESPGGAIRCASGLTEDLRERGIRIRTGIHTGECEFIDGKVGGLAVHIGARVAAAARADEVLVSRTVRDLVAGSGIAFAARGVHSLRGVPGEWELFAVDGDPLRGRAGRTPAVELVGRDAACARIDALLAAARTGRSGALVVRGEAGIGKSALLRYAVERADGMTVLRASGVESESELAFAALADFLRPAARPPERDPGAPGRGAGGRDRARTARRRRPLRGLRATASLLAALAETGPVLGVVDDAQWLDTSSTEALLFAARRLEAEGVALLFAAGEAEAETLERAGSRS